MTFTFSTARTTTATAQLQAGNTTAATLKTAIDVLGAAWATYANAKAMLTPTYMAGEDRIVRFAEFMAQESVDYATT